MADAPDVQALLNQRDFSFPQPTGGVVALVGPDGWRGTVPADKAAELIAKGYQPETAEATQERRLEQEYGDSALRAGVEGLARGATFGLSDVALEGLGADREGLDERRRRNALAAGLGEAAGFVGSAALTGLGSAAGKLGSAAVGEGSGILARAGAAAVRGGLEGGAMGVGQGISDVVLSKDPMTAEAIAGSIGSHVLTGAAIGAGGGAGLSLAASGLGAAIGGASKIVQRVAAKTQAELAAEGEGTLANVAPELRNEVMAMTRPEVEAAQKAEQAALDATRAQQGAALAKDAETLFHDTRNELYALRVQLPDRALMKPAIRASAKLEDVVGDLKSLAEDPSLALKPLRRFGQQLDVIGKYLPNSTLRPISERVNALEQRVLGLMDDATSPRLEALTERLQAFDRPAAATPIVDNAARAAGTAVGGFIGHAVPVPGAGYAGAWLGERFSDVLKPVMRKVLGAFTEHAGAIEDGAQNLLAKVTPPPAALDALKDFATASGVTGANAYEQSVKAITQAVANPQQTQTHLDEQLAGLRAVSPQTADAVKQQLMLRANFLASKLPPQISMGLSGQLVPPSEAEQATFARYVAAASDPLRLLKELRAGVLMPETVETHDALYPSMKAKIEAAITTQLADPVVAARLPYAMRLNLGVLLGPQVDATLEPSFIAVMQTPAVPQIKPPSGGGSTKTNPNDPPTSAQRLTTQ